MKIRTWNINGIALVDLNHCNENKDCKDEELQCGQHLDEDFLCLLESNGKQDSG